MHKMKTFLSLKKAQSSTCSSTSYSPFDVDVDVDVDVVRQHDRSNFGMSSTVVPSGNASKSTSNDIRALLGVGSNVTDDTSVDTVSVLDLNLIDRRSPNS